MSHVYFARKGKTQVYKLGVSVDPIKAVRSLGSFDSFALAYTIPGDLKLKNRIGFHLTRHRLHRDRKDWYDLEPAEIEAVLREISEHGASILDTVRKVEPSRRDQIKATRAFGGNRERPGR